MIVDVIMPKMGESINEGTILEWRKNVGDKVKLDEILLEIGTDKVDSEIPSSAAGVLIEILADPNDVKAVGEVIARIDTDTTAEIIPSEPQIKIEKSEVIKSEEKQVDSPDSLINKDDNLVTKSKLFFTPVVMKIAAENQIPLTVLESITGTGRGGRITKKDILSYIDNKVSVVDDRAMNQPKPNINIPGRSEEMHHMRKLISKHMVESLSTSAHVYVMTEVDMTSIVEFVAKEETSFREKEGYRLTYTPFIVDAVTKAIKEFPEINSSITEETMIHYHRNINIGLAVAINNGLMVPSIPHCEEKNFLGICRSVNDIASRARQGSINSDELTGTTFSITNFGVFGVSIGTPIINQPNVGILGVGAIKKQPVVIELDGSDSIAIRSIMILTLGFDHRLIDGAEGSKFLEAIRKNLENMELRDVV